MLSIPRFARIFILALVLVTVPTAIIFYPSSSSSNEPAEVSLEKGGIDSEHWREPAAPPDPDAERAEAAAGLAAAADEASAAKDGTEAAKDAAALHADPEPEAVPEPAAAPEPEPDTAAFEATIPQDVISGAVIMPHLGNATAKAELGRAAWRVLHLMTLRYPEKPTEGDRAALKSFFHLFSRLYPCGECAEHFQKMLKKYPPQTSSRKTASMWLCEVHNIVNERLHKPDFDCLTLNDVYDCGCANETSSAVANAAKETGAAAPATAPILDSAAD